MGQVYKSIDDQIATLKRRGMKIGDPEKTKEILNDIGYYRLGFYWHPFEETYPELGKRRKHQFKKGTLFEDAVELYYFDLDLRHLLLRYILRIEINFRTQVIYQVSRFYSSNPFWFTDKAALSEEFINSDKFKSKIYATKEEKFIRKDQKKYRRAVSPAWKTLEALSFGVITSIYENLQSDKLKLQIANHYNLSTAKSLVDHINTIRRLRNFCAHGKVLFDMHLPQGINLAHANLGGQSKTSLVSAYTAFRHILSQISSNRVLDMKRELGDILRSIKSEKVRAIIRERSGLKEEII